MLKRARSESELNEAWVGDAVLALHTRLRILDETGRIDAARAAQMSSNQFLSALGEPTAVEAAIGRVYIEQGLAAAFAWIEEHLAPLFASQENNRLRRAGRGPRTRRG